SSCASFLLCSCDPRDLRSFPTRRSSDLLGGGLGSLLLLVTPERTFARLAPWLVLFATALFAFQSLRSARRGDAAPPDPGSDGRRSEEHTSELQSRENLVRRLLLEKKKNK